MNRVIFLVYHGIGHFNSFLGLARILSSRYSVIFAGDSFFENYVKAQGFEFYILNSVPFGLGFENWTITHLKRSNFPMEELRCRRRDELFTSRHLDLSNLIRTWNPKYLFIDSLQSTDFVVVYNELKLYNVRVAFVQTMLSTIITKGYPELNSPFNPDQLLSLKKFQNKSELQWRLNSLLAKVQYLGYDNEFLLKRSFRRNNIPFKFCTKERTIAGRAFSHVTELILSPKELEYPTYKSQPHQHHIGFIFDHKRIEISDTRYLDVLEKIHNNIVRYNHLLIYCSFGTVNPANIKPLKALISRIVSAISHHNRFSLVIASAIFSDFDNGQNVFVLKSVPQIDILNYTNIFITHGGLNSIKEAIYSEVPMIVYPINTNLDQVGNAARVSYHRLGIFGSFDDSIEDIQFRIDQLLTSSAYIENLKKIKSHENKYSLETIMNILDTVSI